ncbi:MAG: hypothetical protein AAGJ87_15320 [Pseudomonadota bacterium]
MRNFFKLCAGLASAAALVAGAGPANAADDLDSLFEEYELTGETTSCLGIRRIRSIDAIDEENFLVRVGLNDFYLNRVSGRCNGADRNSTFLSYKTTQSVLCNNEIIFVVENINRFNLGSCALGKFEELKKIEQPAEEVDAETR